MILQHRWRSHLLSEHVLFAVAEGIPLGHGDSERWAHMFRMGSLTLSPVAVSLDGPGPELVEASRPAAGTEERKDTA